MIAVTQVSMTQEEFLAHAGVEVVTLGVWLERAWILPARTPAGLSFTDMDVARARLIRDLVGDLGVNAEGVDVILHLTDQLHGVRRALAQLRAAQAAP